LERKLFQPKPAQGAKAMGAASVVPVVGLAAVQVPTPAVGCEQGTVSPGLLGSEEARASLPCLS